MGGDANRPAAHEEHWTDRSESLGWWQRLGGANAINLPAWLFTLVGGTLAAFSWIPDGPESRMVAWVALSVAAQVVLGAVLLVARATYLTPRPRRTRPVALIVTLLFAGCLRGALLSLAGEELGLVDQGYVLQRAMGAALAFTVWYSLATLVVDSWRTHRALVTRLRSEMSRDRALAEQSATLITRFRHEVVAQTQAALSAGLESASAASGRPLAAAQSLQHTVDDVIRPLSRELEEYAAADARLLLVVEAPVVSARVPVRASLRGIFTARPFAPLATVAVIVATPLVVSMHLFGPLVGAAAVLSAAAVVGLSLRALRGPIMAAVPRWPWGVSAVVVVGAWVGVTAGAGLLFGAVIGLSGRQASLWMETTGGSSTGAAILSLVAMNLTTMVVAAMDGSVEQQMRTVRGQLRVAVASVEWASARLRQRAWVEQRSFGRLLHGTIQATLVAAALKVRDQTPEEAAETLAGLTTRLRYALGSGAEGPWRQEMSNLSDVWDGAIDLAVTVTPEAESALDQDPLAAHSLVQVLSEGVTNAVRHGDADSVRATVEMEPGYLSLTVMDDGSPSQTTSVPGTGTRILDANCADWSLTFDSTTTLRGRIPWRSDTTLKRVEASA